MINVLECGLWSHIPYLGRVYTGYVRAQSSLKYIDHVASNSIEFTLI